MAPRAAPGGARGRTGRLLRPESTRRRPAAHLAGRVTLLGDAIHPMSPAGGTGANTALRDAAVLADKLTAVRRPAGPVSAVAAYETEMRRYGFAAVAESLRYGERFAQAIRHAGKENHR
ncbi:FAD-dependent oxidoreductase [Streptomyces sp. NPDC048434]|uniref:FAD-dependent oxidoreductase n=1 Tax=Streptomyces sp. NPDC048434 TaxID=3365549 RepID=UPI0037138EA3